MLTVLSPAKKLLTISKPYANDTSEPLLIHQANQLAQIMKSKSVDQIAQLMDLSKNLAELNYKRFQHFTDHNESYPALYLFQGDVYQGLNASTWSQKDVRFAQSHLGILSGLYGLLRPLDRIQPYRLEMGVSLGNPKGKNLYTFWTDLITDTLNQKLTTHANPLLINLASTEYFKAVNSKKLHYPILNIHFYEQKRDDIKMIGIFAKKARGMMARYLMQNEIDSIEQIKGFSAGGYSYNKKMSDESTLSFVCFR